MRKFLLFVVIASLMACRASTPPKKYISIPSLIENQIRHIDTSLYSIKRINSIDTLVQDSGFVRREDFREAVAAFLLIPDLSDPKQAKAFTEEIRYDDLLKRVIITYTPIDAEKTPFQRMELFVEPNLATGDKVQTILVTRRKSDRNGFEQQDLVWQMDRSCTRIERTRKPAEAEQATTFKLSWNE